MKAQKLTKYKWDTEERLLSAQMTAIGRTINNLIDDVASIVPTTNNVTDEDIQDKIDEYDVLLRNANSWLNTQLTSVVNRVSSLEDGVIDINANNETIKGLKQGLYSTFVALGLGEMDNEGNFTVSSATVATTSQLNALNQLVGALQTTSTNTQSQVGLISNWYEKIADGQGNETWVPKYDGAKIMATINNQGQSAAQIIADLINLDGYVKASDIDAQNITAKSLLAKGNSDYPRVVINSTDGIQLLTSASASAININMDGSGSLANGNITWDTNGNLTINGTFKVGAKYIEYIYDSSVEPSVNISTSATGVTASVTVRNTNNFDVYCNVQWYADSTNAVWSTSNTTDILKIDANSSRTIEDGVPAQDIQNYDSSISIDTDHSGADLVNVYHYIDRNS